MFPISPAPVLYTDYQISKDKVLVGDQEVIQGNALKEYVYAIRCTTGEDSYEPL
jgi:hypothetical protein